MRISEDDDTVKLSTKSLSLGRYNVCIRELVDNHRNDIVRNVEIPVRVDVLQGKAPPEYRILHTSRIAIGKTAVTRLDSGETAPPNKHYVEFVKAVHRTSGEAKDLAFGQDGAEVDGRQLLKDFHLQRFEKFGPLHETLYREAAAAEDLDTFNVAVWPRIEHDITGYEKPSEGETKELPAETKALLGKAVESRALVVEKMQKMGVDVKQTPEHALVVLATLTAAQVKELAKDKAIGKMFLDDSTSVPDLINSKNIARAPQAQALGFTGSGVHVAVFENGPIDLTNLQFVDRFLANPLRPNILV